MPGKENVGSLEAGGAIVPRSLQEGVYQRLRQLIFDRGFDVEPLRIQQLAEGFEVSPMPVREALRRLQSDGLVTFTRSRSIIVPRLSPREVEDIFEVRLRLEPFAGRRAAGRITAESLEELEELCAKLEDFSDGDKWRAHNARLHKVIVEASGVSRLVPIVDNLWLAVEPYRRYYIHNRRLLTTAQAQHREIIRSLREKDGHKVERILEEHLTGTLEAIVTGMNEVGSATEKES
jgi:DNA-binding GntR family transcriptional regulator